MKIQSQVKSNVALPTVSDGWKILFRERVIVKRGVRKEKNAVEKQ